MPEALQSGPLREVPVAAALSKAACSFLFQLLRPSPQPPTGYPRRLLKGLVDVVRIGLNLGPVAQQSLGAGALQGTINKRAK